jgi:hypothetical protein
VSVFLRFRYALGSGTRTGTLTVNGVSQSITFNATGSFTTWADKDVLVTLNSGTGNTIRLASTGQDLANIDELTIIAAPLPAPWQTRDIGAVGATGAASFANGTFTVLGDGADIFGTADAFRYVHQNSSGDCSITVRVASLQNTHPFAKAGAMIRESLSASSIEAAIVMTPTNGIRFQVRSTTGGTTANFGSVTGVTAPRFLRLTRSGNTFTAAQSSDGVNFTTVGTPQSISMLSSATLGMAVSSHTNGVLATATFSNVSATP